MTTPLCQPSTTQILFPPVQVNVVNGQRWVANPVAPLEVRFTNLTHAPVTLMIQAAAMWLSCSFEGANRSVQLAPFGSAELEIALNYAAFGGLNEGSTVGQISVRSSDNLISELWTLQVPLQLNLMTPVLGGYPGSLAGGYPANAVPPASVFSVVPQPPQPNSVFPNASYGAPKVARLPLCLSMPL